MKHRILLSAFLLFSTITFAQDANKAYAITGSGNGDFQWMNIREIDLTTGSVSRTIFENGKTKYNLNFYPSNVYTNTLKNILDKTPSIETSNSGELYKLANQSPTATMVAAAAYDQKHQKLFFTPMYLGELRWLDVSSGIENKFYTLKSEILNFGNVNDEANHITRMTIGADGNGYAITNDGNHLIKFSTGKKIVITDLGSLVDASSNANISVHNKCSSWGGDIVADAFGKLYLFTASKNIFKIDIDTKLATYLGSITGLSGVYTVNGAAVDNDDNVVISSANTFDGFYKVKMKDFSATKLNTSGQVYNSSDLANGNLLYASQARNTVGTAVLKTQEIIGNQFISVYPNPVTGSQIQVSFENNKAGVYNIALVDLQGRLLASRQVTIKSAKQMEILQLKVQPANGMYMIKVTDGKKHSVFSDKLVVD